MALDAHFRPCHTLLVISAVIGLIGTSSTFLRLTQGAFIKMSDEPTAVDPLPVRWLNRDLLRMAPDSHAVVRALAIKVRDQVLADAKLGKTYTQFVFPDGTTFAHATACIDDLKLWFPEADMHAENGWIMGQRRPKLTIIWRDDWTR